jgi:hypothetical protein
MDILSDYRMQSRIPSELELTQAAERARIALERAPHHHHRRNLWQLFGIHHPANPVTGPITSPIATHPTA